MSFYPIQLLQKVIKYSIFIAIFCHQHNFLYGAKEDSITLEIPDCDACGCSVSSNVLSPDEIFINRYIGVKYVNQHFKSKENFFVNELNQDEMYNSILLMFKHLLNSKWQVHAIVPYHFNTRKTTPKQEISGLGDMSFLTSYYVYNDVYNAKKSNHSVILNLGIKVPTGKFNEASTSGINPSFQVGTGSWDLYSSIHYQYVKNKLAIQFSADYIVKTTNNREYKYGNQCNTSLNTSYSFHIKETKIGTKAGIMFENFEENIQLSDKIPNTSGNLLSAKLGITANFKKWTFGTDYSFPLKNNLLNGDLEMVSRNSIFIYYSF